MQEKNITTSIKEIVKYWTNRIDESDLSVDWLEAESRCWRCGCERNLQRCHIIPDSLGGKDHPSNLVLLCKRCHEDGPNVKDPEIMWDWIKAYEVPFYDTFWNCMGLKEYKFIYGKTVSSELNSIKEIVPDINVDTIIKEAMEKLKDKASVHFGQPYFNNATMAGLYRLMIKEIAETCNIPFPIPKDEVDINQKPWWYEES